jgi:GT2 family glycosyltransferase
VALIDDDCIAPDDWLASYSTALDGASLTALGGSSETGNPENLFALTNDWIMTFFKGEMNGKSGQIPFLTSNNTVYSRSALREVGGFDVRFYYGAEERDLNLRLAEKGGRIGYEPGIRIRHYNDDSFRKFIRHQYWFGRGSYLLYANARKRGSAPAPFGPGTYMQLLASPFGSLPVGRAFIVSALIVLAQLSLTCGFVVGMLRSDRTGD